MIRVLAALPYKSSRCRRRSSTANVRVPLEYSRRRGRPDRRPGSNDHAGALPRTCRPASARRPRRAIRSPSQVDPGRGLRVARAGQRRGCRRQELAALRQRWRDARVYVNAAGERRRDRDGYSPGPVIGMNTVASRWRVGGARRGTACATRRQANTLLHPPTRSDLRERARSTRRWSPADSEASVERRLHGRPQRPKPRRRAAARVDQERPRPSDRCR